MSDTITLTISSGGSEKVQIQFPASEERRIRVDHDTTGQFGQKKEYELVANKKGVATKKRETIQP